MNLPPSDPVGDAMVYTAYIEATAEIERSVRKEQHDTELRDRFAMAALAPMLSGNLNVSFTENVDEDYITTEKEFAIAAYRMADAMMEARQKTNRKCAFCGEGFIARVADVIRGWSATCKACNDAIKRTCEEVIK